MTEVSQSPLAVGTAGHLADLPKLTGCDKLFGV